MKGIPNEVRITPTVTYDIVWQKKILVGKKDKQSAYGVCCGDAKIIVLKMGISKRLARITLIHEILHAVEFETGVALPHSTIYALETPLEALMRLNGWWG